MIYKILIVIIGILLFIAGITDIRKKQISKIMIFLLSIMCISAVFFNRNFGIYDVLGGFAIGMCSIGISIVSNEQIGRGDGLVITALGILMGFRSCLITVCIASLIMCAVAIIVLICKKGNRKSRLPFLPAIFLSYIFYTSQMLV